MKKIEKSKKNNLFKKIFIKICRIIGFEISTSLILAPPHWVRIK